MVKLKRDDLLYPKLSYQIIGVLFEVYNTLGYGFQEKYYHKAIVVLLKKVNKKFEQEVPVEVKIANEVTTKGCADFIIDGKIILEIKKDYAFQNDNIGQLHSYLKARSLQLGILANFTAKGLLYRRIVNIRNSKSVIRSN